MNATNRKEKATKIVTLHLPETLMLSVQDAAMDQDRSVSEFIRHALSFYLYGMLGGKNDGSNTDAGRFGNRGE